MPESLTVVCVKWGDWCHPHGAAYVNRLRCAVERNLSLAHRFVCFTDDPSGISSEIQIRQLPQNLKGWVWEKIYPNRKLHRFRRLLSAAYIPFRKTDERAGIGEDRFQSWAPIDLRSFYAKLYLFKPGILSGPCLFIDLDTVIVGNIDEIAGYKGDLCILRDLEHARQYGSGLMHFQAEQCSHIWTEFVRQGSPFMRHGDQEFIQQQMPDADFFQDLYPGQVVSYKLHCEKKGVPPYARIVCFHGLPRPHMVSNPEIAEAWSCEGKEA